MTRSALTRRVKTIDDPFSSAEYIKIENPSGYVNTVVMKIAADVFVPCKISNLRQINGNTFFNENSMNKSN
jgi:hypothetical protein